MECQSKSLSTSQLLVADSAEMDATAVLIPANRCSPKRRFGETIKRTRKLGKDRR